MVQFYKLALGSVAGALVFAVGAVPPLLSAATWELLEQFRRTGLINRLALGMARFL